MKSTAYFLNYIFLTLSLLYSSCVPNRKFAISNARVDKLENDNAFMQNKLNNYNSRFIILNEEKIILQKDYKIAKNDLKTLSDESKLTIDSQDIRLKNLIDLLKLQNDAMTELLNTMIKALMNFKTDELNVYIKDGSVYVSLEEKLLFVSGSDEVNVKGKEALGSLAAILNKTKDINVMIEGHTDNVPIKTKSFEDNWDLSTARALSILHILTDDYGFDTYRITASGRGEFHPVKSNETSAGRAANRRTEIILSPDLKELESLLYL